MTNYLLGRRQNVDVNCMPHDLVHLSPTDAVIVIVVKLQLELSILLKETRVCVFAKLDQFLPVRSQFDSNQHVNSLRIATFQSANFAPLLFALYCPLLFYENKIKNE